MLGKELQNIIAWKILPFAFSLFKGGVVTISERENVEFEVGLNSQEKGTN